MLAVKALTPRLARMLGVRLAAAAALVLAALTPRVLAVKALTPRLARMLAAPNPFPPAPPVNPLASR